MEKGQIIDVARRLRRDMPDAERRIWKLLRQPPFAVHRFRRQVPFGRYVADFASHGLRLVIEIDGSQHDVDDRAERKRTSYLEGRGYRVLRFWNRDVLLNGDGVGEVILRAVGRGDASDAG